MMSYIKIQQVTLVAVARGIGRGNQDGAPMPALDADADARALEDARTKIEPHLLMRCVEEHNWVFQHETMPLPTSPKGDAALLHASLRAAQASVSVLCALLGSNDAAGQPSASAREALAAAAAAAAALDSISLKTNGEGGFLASSSTGVGEEEEEIPASKVERSAFVSVADGAAGIQRVLESLGAGEAVAVHWLAPWVPDSVDLDGALREGRLNHPALAGVVSLDVVASPANRAFAFDQVVALPASRRPDSKPVLKSGNKFPCLTLHAAPQLYPLLARHDGEAAWRAMVDSIDVALGNETIASPVLAEPGATQPLPSSPPPSPRASFSPAQSWTLLTKGAGEFKKLLQEAGDAPLLAVFVAGADEAQAWKQLCAPLALLGVCVDVALSPSARLLAGGLGARSTPAAQIFQSMRCVRKWSKAELEALMASHTVAEAICTAVPALAPARDSGGGGCTLSVAVSEPDCQGAPQPFAPPEGKFARPGATQVLSSGMVAHFFPKMPCLRCGCPWWSTDDWDGRCIRCGWDCEAQGYDDDSQPRAAHRARWTHLVALLQRGITPVWSG